MKIKKSFVFITIVWFLILVIGEIGIRLHEHIKETKKVRTRVTYNPASMFIAHPFTAYAANPKHYDHNAQGFRAEKNILYAADPDSIKIVCLGGSSTYGTRVFKEDSYPRQLEKVLSGYSDKKVNVINAGLPGYSTANIISLLSLKIIDLNPDIIIFYVGFNDAWNRLVFSGFKNDYTHAQQSWKLAKPSFWRKSRLLEVIADLLGYPPIKDPHIHSVAWKKKTGNPENNLRNSSAEAFKRNLRTLIGIARTHGVIPILVTQATDFKDYPVQTYNNEWIRAMQEHTEITKQVANEMSVDLIDINSLMIDQKEYFADVLHMNIKGNRKRAQIIAEYLVKNKLIRSSYLPGFF
ncbi:MAG: SGNH/GDSL hydrolase family protein [Candidatus Omnitrophota bacterium]